jgi:hypothetical protein
MSNGYSERVKVLPGIQTNSVPRSASLFNVRSRSDPDMPEFSFEAADVGAIVAYLRSIQQPE